MVALVTESERRERERDLKGLLSVFSSVTVSSRVFLMCFLCVSYVFLMCFLCVISCVSNVCFMRGED